MSGPPPAKPRKGSLKITTGAKETGQRVALYGEGGIGKTSLAALAPKPLVLDCEDGSDDLDVARVKIENWPDLINALSDEDSLAPFETIVIDSATAVQEMLKQHVCQTKGVQTIEGIDFGKGWSDIYDNFVKMLGRLDALARSGKHVIVICHVVNTVEKNPEGNDYGEFQPDLLMQGKTCHIRTRVKGWCNHMLFLKYDRSVGKDGKERASGTRTVFVQKGPGYWAKSRRLRDDVPFIEGDDRLWIEMGIKKESA